MTYTFIAQRCSDLPVAACCRVMGVSTSGFYAWRANPVSDRDWNDAVLTNTIFDIHRMSRRSYGSPRVHAELVLGQGKRCSRKRVARLMAQAGIVGIHRRHSRAAPERIPTPTRPKTWSSGTSTRPSRTGCGSWTSPSTRPTRARSTWPSSSMLGADGSSAGRSPTTSVPSSSSTPSRWRSGEGDHRRDGRWPTRTTGSVHLLGLRSPAPGRRAPRLHGNHRRLLRQQRRARASSGPSRSNCSTNTAGTPAGNWLSPCSTGSRAWYNPSRRHSYCSMLSPVDYERPQPAAAAA